MVGVAISFKWSNPSLAFVSNDSLLDSLYNTQAVGTNTDIRRRISQDNGGALEVIKSLAWLNQKETFWLVFIDLCSELSRSSDQFFYLFTNKAYTDP